MPNRASIEGASLTVEIKRHLAHYAFSEGLRRDAEPKPASEFLSLWLFGEVLAPADKRGRDVQISVAESEHVASAGRAFETQGPVIGNLSWSATRVARVYVPPGTLWNLAHGVGSGLFTQIRLALATPTIRGNMDVRGMHWTTGELTLAGLAAEDDS